MPTDLCKQTGRDALAETLRRRAWLGVAAGYGSDPFFALAQRLRGNDLPLCVPFLERHIQSAAHTAGCVERIAAPEQTEAHLAYPAGEGARPVRLACGAIPTEAPPEAFSEAFDRLAADVDAVDAAHCAVRGSLPGVAWSTRRVPNHPYDWDYEYKADLSFAYNSGVHILRYSLSAAVANDECTTFDVWDTATWERVPIAATAANVASIALPGGAVDAGLSVYDTPYGSSLVSKWRQLFGSAREDGGMAEPLSRTGYTWSVKVSSDAGALALVLSIPPTPVVENPTPYPGTVYARAVRPDPATGSGANRSEYDRLGLSGLPEAEGAWWSFSLPAWSRRPLFGDPNRTEDVLFPWQVQVPSGDGLGGRRLPATGCHTLGFRIHPDDIVIELDLDSSPTPFHPIS